MMTLGNISGTAPHRANNRQKTPSEVGRQADPVSKRLMKQIANAQKKLQDLASNTDLTPEEKMKKGQEIQQEINSLNQQLRQHQMELRREAMNHAKEQQENSSSAESAGGTKKAGKKSAGLSQAGMQFIISADSAIKQAKAQGHTATRLEGQTRVLAMEIKQDQSRGSDTSKKQASLAALEERAQNAKNSGLSMLADANRTMEKSAKSDRSQEKEDDKDSRTETEEQKEQTVAYTSVDIRL